MKMAAAFFLVVMLRTYVIPFVASSVALFAEMIQCERYVCLSYSIRGGGEETKMFFIRQPWRSLCIGASVSRSKGSDESKRLFVTKNIS